MDRRGSWESGMKKLDSEILLRLDESRAEQTVLIVSLKDEGYIELLAEDGRLAGCGPASHPLAPPRPA